MKFLAVLMYIIGRIGVIILWIWAVSIAWKFSWLAVMLTAAIPFLPIIYWAERLSGARDGHIYLHPFSVAALAVMVIFGLSCLANFLSNKSK